MSVPPRGVPALASKLQPPRLGAQHVPRPRLVDRLRQHADRPLLLLCAAAGSGKTTLLAEWIATDADRPTAWVALDERDNDLMLFLTYLLAALQPLAPARRFPTRALQETVHPPPLATLAASLSNDLAQFGRDVRLVLDDYHRLANPQIDALLRDLLRHPSRRLQLVVATRTEPNWPLASWRANGRLSDLGTTELQFTADEAATFIRGELGDAIGDEGVASLYAQSEGWAVGLQLLTLVAHRSGAAALPSPLPDSVANDAVRAYLFGEVLSQQSPATQEWLRELSILERFSGALCEAICRPAADPGWGEPLLAELERRNLFLARSADNPPIYRFHHLFRAFLRERLHAEQTPEQIAELHRRAGDWFAAHGWLEEAITHYLAAGEAPSAGEALARARHDLYNREQFARLARLLDQLPAAAKARSPELLLADARVLTRNWRLTEAASLLDQAERVLAASTLSEPRVEAARGELATLRAVSALWQGDGEQLAALGDDALRRLPAEASHVRGLAHIAVAAAQWQQGHPDQARAFLEAQLAETSPHVPVYATLLQGLAFFAFLDGDFAGLAITATRFLRVSDELELPEQAALAHYLLGLVHYARNALDQAERELMAAVEARFHLRLVWWTHAAGLLALVWQALGQEARGQSLLAEASDFVLDRHAVRLLPSVGAVQAELDRRAGRLAAASAWAEQVAVGPLTWALEVIPPRLVQARVWLAHDQPAATERAAVVIAELRAFCARVPSPRLSLEVEALAVVLQDRQGERAAALATLEALVLAAEPQGWLRLFVDLGEPMARLLHALATRAAPPPVVAAALAAFPAPERAPALRSARQLGLIEPLSDRELEVLARLAQRESNKEIADRLFIATSTVKRHTLNIYRKLDVNDRRDAVVRGQALGLLAAATEAHSGTTVRSGG